jgi:hypothetical protein
MKLFHIFKPYNGSRSTQWKLFHTFLSWIQICTNFTTCSNLNLNQKMERISTAIGPNQAAAQRHSADTTRLHSMRTAHGHVGIHCKPAQQTKQGRCRGMAHGGSGGQSPASRRWRDAGTDRGGRWWSGDTDFTARAESSSPWAAACDSARQSEADAGEVRGGVVEVEVRLPARHTVTWRRLRKVIGEGGLRGGVLGRREWRRGWLLAALGTSSSLMRARRSCARKGGGWGDR